MAQVPESMPSQVKLDTVTTPAGFGEAFARAGMKETLLGELGSSIAQSSANALSTKMGYDEGMNPHGDILPPITEADKHYQASYLAQSKNVLGLQLNKMMDESQTQLSKAYRITPGMISEFQKNIGQGAGEILKNAPNVVKQELGTQYANSIISTTGQLNRRMIGQNKEEAISAMKVADKNTDTAILDNAASGNEKLAHDLYQQKIEQNKKQRAAGMMTPLEQETSNTAAKLSYFSGVSNARAIEARNKKGDALGKYLAGFADLKNKPHELSFSEWNTIGNNTLGLMRHMDSLQQTDKNLIISDLNEKLAENKLTEQDILSAYQSPSVNDTDLNNLLSKMYSSRGKATTKQQKIQGLTTNFSNAQAFGESSGETINDTYSNLVQATKDKNPNLSPMEAEASIASMAGGSIPRFLNTVANLSKSNNLDDVVAASNAYHRVQSVSPQNVIGLNEDAYNFISAFDTFKEQNPGDPQSALEQTRNALIKRTPDEKKAIDETWNAAYRKNYSTPEQRASLARKMLGTDTYFNSTYTQNQAVANDHITNMLEKNVKLLGGDLESAKQMTEKAVKNVYGDTWVNGRHEMAYLSVEKIANLGGEDSTFFVQKDIVDQLQTSLTQYKEAYNAGHSDYYYRLKDPGKYDVSKLKTPTEQKNVNTKEMAFIEERLSEIAKQPYTKAMELDSEYKALTDRRAQIIEQNRGIEKGFTAISKDHKPIELEKVWRGNGAQTLKPTLTPPGLIAPGNIDLVNRKKLSNANGTESTVSTMTVGMDDKTFLIPTVIDGKRLSQKEAIEHFKKTKEHMGVFKSVRDADLYDEALHIQQGWLGKENKWPKYKEDKEGQVQVLNVAVVPETNTTLSYDNAQPVIGNYFVKLSTPNGHIENLDSITGFKSAPIYYAPNFGKIREDYTAFHNRFGNQPTYEDALKEYERSKKVVNNG